MKKFVMLIFVFAALTVASPLFAQDLLEQIDSLVSFTENDFSAEYTITQDKPGQGTSVTKAAMFRRDSEDKYLILILEPSVDRGKGYLKIGNNLWLYDPVSRRFNVTSARDRFQNSNARNSDFTQSTLAADYRIVGRSSAQLGAYSTRVLDLEATNDSVTYPAMKIWVDENNLVRKYEDYSLSGQLMRTTAIPRYQAVGERFVPVQIVIIDALAGRNVNGQFRNERTIITVAKPSLNDLPDLVFTQAYLERVSE
ncbi:outer membrane lipoprotein-sorting protein [Salinispira pacifica]|nr:outer membrane lipoprotein-sorting protein [Salinispira pacifica]